MSLKKFNLVISFSLMFLLCIGTLANAVTDDENFNVLEVDEVKQEKNNWCWAATTKCVADYLGGEDLSQRQIVKKVKGEVIDEGATSKEQKKALNKDGIDTVYRSNSISFSKVKKEIDNDRPILVHIDRKRSDTDHALVINGYGIDGYGDGYVYYMEPGRGMKTWCIMSYDDFEDNRNFSWARTYYKNEVQ